VQMKATGQLDQMQQQIVEYQLSKRTTQSTNLSYSSSIDPLERTKAGSNQEKTRRWKLEVGLKCF